MATKKTTMKKTTVTKISYDRTCIAADMSDYIKDRYFTDEDYEKKKYHIDSLVNSIIEKEDKFIQQEEAKGIHALTTAELAHSLVYRHSNEVTDICCNNLDDEDGVETEEYSSGHEKEHEELMNKLYRAAFYAFSQVDFVDMVDMLNYRCVEFSKVGPRDKKDESLEAQYITNEPGDYEVVEIQKYVYEIVMESLNRFRDELDCGMLENDPEHLIGEYYNHSSGIYCRVLKNGVEISYMPINSFGDVDFDI